MKLTRKKLRIAGIVILAIFALSYAKQDVTMAGNESSRFAVIQSVGEQGVFYIENTEFKTVDRVVRDGHVYSDKPLPISWVIGMIYRIPHRLWELNFHQDYYLLIGAVNAIFFGLVNILIFLWLFGLFCRNNRGHLLSKFLLALGASLGTWLLSYSVTINNHTPAALCVLGLYVALDKFRRSPTVLASVASGLAAGLAVACDMPTGAVFAVVAMLGVWWLSPPGVRRWQLVSSCAVAGGAVGIGIMALNFYAYRTILPLYVAGGTGTFQEVGAHAYNLGKYIVDNLIWTRGLFSYQPFLLLVIPAFWVLWPTSQLVDRLMLTASVFLIATYLFITDEYGGWAYGFRYLIPLIPVLWYWAGRWVLAVPGFRIRKVLATILILIGVVTALVGSYTPFCVSYEAHRSPPGHFTQKIQSSFMGNLLTWSYDTAPDSRLTRKLFEHYGTPTCLLFLHAAATNSKDIVLLKRVTEDIQRLYPEQ